MDNNSKEVLTALINALAIILPSWFGYLATKLGLEIKKLQIMLKHPTLNAAPETNTIGTNQGESIEMYRSRSRDFSLKGIWLSSAIGLTALIGIGFNIYLHFREVPFDRIDVLIAAFNVTTLFASVQAVLYFSFERWAASR